MIGDASCRVLMQLLAYAYPAYLTYKDIERGADDQLARWSKYWLVIAGLTALQPAALLAQERDADRRLAFSGPSD